MSHSQATPPTNHAFGQPGIEPRWTRSDKDGVGTAYSASSRIWFTVSNGVLNEVYHPTIDRPQIRDLLFLVTDGETFFTDERRNTLTRTERICQDSLGYRIINEDVDGRFRIEKEIITAPHAPCVLVHTKFIAADEWKDRLKIFVLLAPHLDVGGWGNNGQILTRKDCRFLVAHKNDDWLALGCTNDLSNASVGYVGVNDGWQDLKDNFKIDWNFESATDGNIAMVAEIDVTQSTEFTVGLGISDHQHGALTALTQTLGVPFAEHLSKFRTQWQRACKSASGLDKVAQDGGSLYRTSNSLLLAHEDKTYQGAMIASLSIPWGEAKSDEDLGGYHLVWTRDMVNSATGLLAAGNTETPFRALMYLACSQLADGGFHQNFWINGDPYWTGVQLDEVAFPILLAWKLYQNDGLRDFDAYPMVKAAAGYLIRNGPATPQERWEENSGYSPSTLASNIAALTCAALMAKEHGETVLGEYLHEYADFLNCHIEKWTVTTEGSLLPDVPRHFIRIHPVDIANPIPNENPNVGSIIVKNRPPYAHHEFPAKEIVDGGFLELVRYGIRDAGDQLFEDSLKVVDSVLKVDTPSGPCWRRYNHDGYGQQSDGGPFIDHGQGRAWPLLTGERAHYEFAAGRDVTKYISAIESFATNTGLLPEQIWDEADRPEFRMQFGKPTGSAMPLMWAHAEYIKLLRSVRDGVVFDRIPEVAERYINQQGSQQSIHKLDVWKFNRQIQTIEREVRLRIQGHTAFTLRATNDGWNEQWDTVSYDTGIGVHFCDIRPDQFGNGPLEFTFLWESGDWEGKNYRVAIAR